MNTDELRDFLGKGLLDIIHIRGIIVGCTGAGKTTLFTTLQDMLLKTTCRQINSTEIADVHVNSFELLKKKKTIRGTCNRSKLSINTSN